MKTSISVPDDLWDCVKDLDDGPSAVVQQALTLLCQRKQDPMANAPSDAVKDRVRDAVAAQVERIAGAARRLAEDGYELGVAISSHLSLIDLLSLPADRTTLQNDISTVFDGATFMTNVSAFEDFTAWKDAQFDTDLLLDENAAFWSHLDLAVERHIESAADDISDSGSISIPWRGYEYAWVDHPTPEGWSVPEGDPEIARYFLIEGRLPGAYLNGIAGALLDLRAAASAYAGTDQIDTPSAAQPAPTESNEP